MDDPVRRDGSLSSGNGHGTGNGRRLNFDDRPILVFWETTRACPLACRHCRASAIHTALPGELNTAEGLALIDDIRSFGPRPPVLIMTGGDPLARPDLFELAGHASRSGIPIGFAPAVSPNLTDDAVKSMWEAGAKTVSISLDGATAETHEGVRQVPGIFPETLDAVRRLVAAGFSVQINTTVMRSNVDELPEIAALVSELGAHIWEVFFLIKTGRGSELEELTPEENEEVSNFLYDASRYSFIVRTVEGPFFRRVTWWRRAGADGDPATRFGLGPLYVELSTRLRELLGEPGVSRAQTAGTRDGKGIVFVAHNGDVYPSGFLPCVLGNVRETSIVDLYRSDPLMRSIRGAAFGGRCGACEFKDTCGGSRSRAYAASGDPLGEDPGCWYVPALSEP